MPTLGKTKVSPSLISTGSLFLGTSSYAVTASFALNSSGGGGGGSVQTGSIAKQTVWTNVTSGSTNTITSLNLSSNKWDVSVVEEWDAATLDQYYNSCSLLCHFDKLNSSGSFIDNSRNNLTITSVNGETISNVQSKFGGASAFFDGTNDYVTIADTVPLRLGSTAYTIEAWIYLLSLPSSGTAWSIFQQNQHIGGGNFLELIVSNSGGTYYIEGNLYNSSVYKYSVTKTVTNLLNVWHHVALIWTGTTAYVSFDGVLSTGVSYSGNDAPSTPTTYIGLYYAATSYYFNGYIDELRVTKGVARYTSNFRPPPLPFPNSRNQVLTRYVGLVGGIDDKYVDYGVQKLSNSSLKLTRLTYPNQPLIGSGSLSGSVSRVYVNVLDYTNVSVTSSYARNSLSASYLIPTSNNTTKAIFGYGYNGSINLSMVNLVSNTGVVANDTTGVGTARYLLAAAGYGTDKAIFGYGYNGSINLSITNLVSNTGVVANDTTGVGTARNNLAAAGYGTDKAIFGYGYTSANASMTNLVSNTGVVATDTTGIGTARNALAAAGYGTDKAIFGYGYTSAVVSMTNLVSNTGVVATDTTGIGTARNALTATGYGTDKAIFGYGITSVNVSMTNLVSNTGVVATDTTGVGTARYHLKAAGYGGDKAIFGYGYTGANVSMINLVSNTGVVENDTTGVGTARWGLAAAGYSTS